jgi:anti-anti-sigma factor
MSQLNIQVDKASTNDQVTVISLSGDIDANTYKSLQDRASEVIGDGAAKIVLDLQDVGYMGSAGFRAIHAIANMLNEDQSEHVIKSENLKLANPNADISKVIKTLGFDAYLEIFSSADDAVASF